MIKKMNLYFNFFFLISHSFFFITCIDYEQIGINRTDTNSSDPNSVYSDQNPANFGQDAGKYGSVNIGPDYNPVKLTAGKRNFNLRFT